MLVLSWISINTFNSFIYNWDEHDVYIDKGCPMIFFRLLGSEVLEILFLGGTGGASFAHPSLPKLPQPS